MDHENARVWLESFAAESDAAAFERARRLASEARLEAGIARAELDAHQREHRFAIQ
jgi:hypothetical protein